MNATAATLSPLQQDVIRIARADTGRSILAGARSQRPLANPRLEALRRYATGSFTGTATPKLLVDAGYDATERAAIDTWIAGATRSAKDVRRVQQRRQRFTDAAAIGIAVVSLCSFATLNAVLLVGAY